MSARFCFVLIAAAGLVGCPTPEADDPMSDMPVVVDNNSSNPDMSVTPDEPDMPAVEPDMPMVEPDMPMNGVCQDITVYSDIDGDGVGSAQNPATECLLPGQDPSNGLVRAGGDCDDMDPLRFDGAPGVCGDSVDDSCDGKDETCPASMPGQMNIPDWDCTGDPPSNVYAYAAFEEANSPFTGGSCFYFFEGEPKVFYARRLGFETADGCQGNQCICPGGYDQRLYAFTTRTGDEACPEIVISQSGPGQPVSNACRKYLYQMNLGDTFSFVATGVDNLDRRLSSFSKVEVACVKDTTLSASAFPFSTLLEADIVKNDGYQPL